MRTIVRNVSPRAAPVADVVTGAGGGGWCSAVWVVAVGGFGFVLGAILEPISDPGSLDLDLSDYDS